MNAHLTVRNLPPEIAAALEKEKRRRGASLNQTVIDLLRVSLGVQQDRRNGLARLAGTWSEAQQTEFLASVQSLDTVDEELWEVSRYCIDTVTYSHFKRGEPRTVELLETAEWIGISAIVLGELCAGFEQGSHRTRNHSELNQFLASPVVETIPVDRQTAQIFGEIVADLRRRGTPIPTNDIWIAASCAREGASLLTWDSHFRRIPRVGTVILD